MSWKHSVVFIPRESLQRWIPIRPVSRYMLSQPVEMVKTIQVCQLTVRHLYAKPYPVVMIYDDHLTYAEVYVFPAYTLAIITSINTHNSSVTLSLYTIPVGNSNGNYGNLSPFHSMSLPAFYSHSNRC